MPEPMKLPYDLVIVDCQTNGLEYPDARIIEFGSAILRTDGTLGPHLSQLIDGRPMGERPSSITSAMLEGKPLFGEFAPRFPRWCWDHSKNFILASWGAASAIALLRQEYHRASAKFPFAGNVLCAKSVALAHFWKTDTFVASSGVDKALRMMGLEFEGTPHRAGDDAHNIARILQRIFGFSRARKETA